MASSPRRGDGADRHVRGRAGPCTSIGLSGRLGGFEQLVGGDIEATGDPLERPKGEISLAPLQASDIGSVPAKELGEGLLGETFFQPPAAKVVADDSLQLSFGHVPKVLRRYARVYRPIGSVPFLSDRTPVLGPEERGACPTSRR